MAKCHPTEVAYVGEQCVFCFHSGLPGGPSPRFVSGEKYDRAFARASQLSAKVAALTEAILNIDAKAVPLAATEEDWVAVGYFVPIGPLHKALGVIGHASAKNIDVMPPEWFASLIERAVARTQATEATARSTQEPSTKADTK